MKLIKIPSETKEKIINDFEKEITEFREKLKNSDRMTQTFEFKFNPPQDLAVPDSQKNTIPRPKIIMSAATYLKMLQYVLKINIECAWHGFVTRLPNNVFNITDVKMYPHIGSAAFVESDDDEYSLWKNGQPNKDNTIFIGGLTDEELTHLRFQGHSHVNMAVSPSTTDLTDQKGFMNELIDILDAYKNEPPEVIESFNPFYIFAIMNKKEEINWFIYDYASGILFEKEDIDFTIMYSEDYSTQDLEKEIASTHKTQTYTYNYNYNYKKPNTTWEVQCRTSDARIKFLESDFYSKYKKHLTAETDKNLGITFFNATSKDVLWEELKNSEFYLNTYGLVLVESTQPVKNNKKKTDELAKKIEKMVDKGEIPYILIEHKSKKFDEIHTKHANILEFIGEPFKVAFEEGQEKKCFCITHPLYMEDASLECILDMQAAGFSFRSLILKENVK